jgi:hypothetical protein
MLSHGKFYTIAHFFTDKVDDYWHILYPVLSKEKREEDKYLYFLDLSRKALDYDGELKENGVYQFLGYDGDYCAHPLEIAQYGLASWLAWRKSGDEQWIEHALNQCSWLVDNQEESGAWYIRHKNPLDHDLPLPWVSGMANGLAISALVRAYWFTKEEQYLTAAKKAYDFLELNVKDGGVKRYLDDETYVYEESVKPQLEGILNGHLFSMFGIYDLSLEIEVCKVSFWDNIKNLKKILPKFDMGYWSYYCMSGEIASGFYHRLVVFQLQSLAEYDSYFLEFSVKMQGYVDNKFYALRALIAKMRHRSQKLKEIKEAKHA